MACGVGGKPHWEGREAHRNLYGFVTRRMRVFTFLPFSASLFYVCSRRKKKKERR